MPHPTLEIRIPAPHAPLPHPHAYGFVPHVGADPAESVRAYLEGDEGALRFFGPLKWRAFHEAWRQVLAYLLRHHQELPSASERDDGDGDGQLVVYRLLKVKDGAVTADEAMELAAMLQRLFWSEAAGELAKQRQIYQTRRAYRLAQHADRVGGPVLDLFGRLASGVLSGVLGDRFGDAAGQVIRTASAVLDVLGDDPDDGDAAELLGEGLLRIAASDEDRPAGRVAAMVAERARD